MSVRKMQCPSCGRDLPPESKPNHLITCPACNSTLYLSDWNIGQNNDAVLVATPTRVYTVTDLLGKDDLCNIYRCIYPVEQTKHQGMFRLTNDPYDNDLMQNEAKTLYHLQGDKDYDDFRAFIPVILEAFLYQDSDKKAKQVNICGLHPDIGEPNELYTLEEVHQYYLNGIDPRDMAWMWRRVLYILGFIHGAEVIHGAIVPWHILIEPKEHKLMISGWGFSVRNPKATGNHLKAMSLSYEKWYPASVKEKKPPTAALDIGMAARCMMYLIGAEPTQKPKHRNLDSQLERYFTKCIEQQPQDAWQLLSEFDKIIENLWGERKFRIFTMPYKA